jgi:deoxycytidine triphosphate deaminase
MDEPLDTWLTPQSNLTEAEERATYFRNRDPFPQISRALLSGPHIEEYARRTAMIFPAYGIKRDGWEGRKGALKTASYETQPGGTLIYFDETDRVVRKKLNNDKHGSICLPANSITFVSTRDRFFLPNYIALRFNLRIKHVHRGILLGTGPIVDPGYDKEILIPLHNLTDSDYYISVDEGLIWIEFTKTSADYKARPAVKKTMDLSFDQSDELPDNTKKDIEEYLFKANNGFPIRSSIPKAILDAKNAVESTSRRVAILQGIGILALVSLVIGLVSVFVSVLTLVSNAQSNLRNLEQRITNLEK